MKFKVKLLPLQVLHIELVYDTQTSFNLVKMNAALN